MNTVFLGNGPSLVKETTYSWQNLLGELATSCGRPDLADPAMTKPFTLVFDEMVFCASDQGEREDELKQRVARLALKLQPNRVHRRIGALPVANVITTNYDYAFENGMGTVHSPASLSSETRYSLFRRRSSGTKNVWHLHGEADVPATITLGHDQYVGYLTKTKNYLTSDRARKRSGEYDYRSPMVNGITDFETTERYSWIDHFLRDDLRIVGFGLDYSEIAIWWLLSYKARLRRNNPRTPKNVPVGSTTYYFMYPSPLRARDQEKRSLLQSMGVTVRMYDAGPDWSRTKAAWDKCLDDLEADVRA